MRIKLDENLPSDLVAALRQLGHDVESVPQENLAGAPDHVVWQAAQNEERFLITQDLDFSHNLHINPIDHHGVLLLRLTTPTRRRLIQRVEAIFASEVVSQWRGCLVVATDRKIRIRAPRSR